MPSSATKPGWSGSSRRLRGFRHAAPLSVVDLQLSLRGATVRGLAVRAAGMALGLAVTVFLGRTLGAEELGAYVGTLAVCTILANLVASPADRLAARRIAALGDDPTGLAREIGAAHIVVGLSMLAVELVLVAGSVAPFPEETRTVFRLAVLVAPVLAILALRQWIALALQGVAASLGPEQIGLPILFLAAAGIAARQATFGPTQALLIYGAAGGLVWLVSSWRSGLLSLLRDGVRELPSWSALRRRFREGRPFVLLSTVGVVPIYATVPVVAALLDLADAGRLAIAMQLTGLVAVPLQIVSLAIMPRCARLHHEGDTEALNTLVRTASTISFALGLGLAAALLASSDLILGILGPTFAATSGLISVLVVGQLVNAALGPNGPTLQMIGFERDAAWVETAAMVLRLLAVAVAASVGSILGVAFAIAATTTLRNLLLSIALYRRAGIVTLPQLPRRRDHRR